MKNKLVILLVEDDAAICAEFYSYFLTCEDMTIIDQTNDIEVAMQLTTSHLPNVILLDLELHNGGGNGLVFLDNLRKRQMMHTPYIIVTTQNMSEYTLEQARLLGADFIITKYDKKFCPEYIANTIRLMHGAILRKNTSIAHLKNASPAQEGDLLERRIQREMELIGINPKNKGYAYLVDSIQNYIKNPGINLSRSLVPKYEKSEKSIERAMQNAIKRAWDTNDIEDLLKYYTARIRADKGSPTLMEFVCYYANKIKSDIKSERLGNKPIEEDI